MVPCPCTNRGRASSGGGPAENGLRRRREGKEAWANGRRAVLTLRGVSKSVGGLKAVIDVDLDLYEGEVLAIVGDNRAGKSTLIKILTGVHKADIGEIKIDGKTTAIASRRDSIDAGIEAVYQNLGLVNSLPAAHNVFRGQEPVRRILGIPFIDNRRMREETQRILRERVGIVLDNLDDPVHNYSGGQRQAVAIARAIFNTDLRVLVLDEPTAALGPQETRKTLDLIRGVRDRGISAILISRNLENVFSVADRVQVMRGGRSVGVVDVANAPAGTCSGSLSARTRWGSTPMPDPATESSFTRTGRST